MNSNERTTASGLKWSAIDKFATQAIQLIIMLVLAKVLGPEVFGLIAILTVFISVSQVIIEGGFNAALIQRLNRTEKDFSTTFYFNFLTSLLLYLLLYLFSPYVADFYQQPDLELILRVLGLNLIFSSFSFVQKAKLSIEMDFQTQAKASLFSVMISSSVVLLLAKYDYGIWSLVFQTLSYSLFNSLLLNIYHPWLPKDGFSIRSFKRLFGFGSKLLISGVIDSIYKNIYQIVTGKYFSPVDVGHFTQSNQIATTPAMTLTTIIQRVTFPLFSAIQDNQKKLNESYLLTMKVTALITFPLMFGLAAIAKPFISVVLGHEWLPAVEILQILTIGSLLYPVHAMNLNMLMVKGRTDIFLKVEIIKKIITTFFLFVTIPLGIKAIAIGVLVQSYLALIINGYFVNKVSGLTINKMIAELGKIWIISVLSCMFGRLISTQVFDNNLGQIIINVFVSFFTYVILIKVFESQLFRLVLDHIKPKEKMI